MSEPRVTVVVATRDRPDSLRVLLDALNIQTIASEHFETVIVDDGSATALNDSVHLQRVINVRVIRHEKSRGPAAARNTGWRAARAPLVAFTDDDCRPDRDWLSRLLEASCGDSVIVQGKTMSDPLHPRPGPFSRTLAVGGPSGFYETANIAYPRRLLELTGGFDESYRHACGEDVDLGWRAKKMGARLVFAERAVVHHAVTTPSLFRTLRHTALWTDAVRVLKTHPELRSSLVARVFWKRTHPRLLIFLLGLVASGVFRQPVIGLMSGVPYVALYRRQYGELSRPWRAVASRLPRHFVIDACEVATMVTGSIRHRTLML